uniref:Aquaporin n=1 Tax=Anomala cuprea TaxID=121601 RepID=M1VMW0_ANOCP|nr:aquaporin [Anomala cuprea]
MSKDMKAAESYVGLSELTASTNLWRALCAEFIGTFLLVLIGCGTILQFKPTAAPSIVAISLAFGLIVATLAQAIGHVSGCHVNPAVTLSLFVTGDCKLIRSCLYIVVQCLGAMAGSAMLMVATPSDFQGNLGATAPHADLAPAQAFFYEAVLTFLLCFVIHGVCDAKRKDIKGSAPLAIGLAITACHLSGIKYTGSSINPARSFGPAVIKNNWHNHWIYWAGPIIGGLVAGLIYKFIFKVPKDEEDSMDF